MTEQEYKDGIATLEYEFEASKKKLMVAYAQSQRKFKIGDIIRHHDTTIIIDSITAYISLSDPMPVYVGKELKKDLTPKKNGSIEKIYGNSNVELLKPHK